ncbi:hypothetical protein PR048_014034 [Dryococelus australis]|uniref:Uncharacterized protein n=1 Tax=Dryococelus australis TaxID=614101 RepID=A0ABQ9HU00_9NEOP|nr:hypothetical protein PR048_014034 [Dryococelus australis]
MANVWSAKPATCVNIWATHVVCVCGSRTVHEVALSSLHCHSTRVHRRQTQHASHCLNLFCRTSYNVAMLALRSEAVTLSNSGEPQTVLTGSTAQEHSIDGPVRPRGGAISTLASHQGEPGSIPDRVNGFSQVGTVPDDAIGRRVFSRISRFPPPLNSGAAPFSRQSPSSALKTSPLRAAQISSPPHSLINNEHAARREPCTPVHVVALRGDGALDTRGSLTLIAPAFLCLRVGKTVPDSPGCTADSRSCRVHRECTAVSKRQLTLQHSTTRHCTGALFSSLSLVDGSQRLSRRRRKGVCQEVRGEGQFFPHALAGLAESAGNSTRRCSRLGIINPARLPPSHQFCFCSLRSLSCHPPSFASLQGWIQKCSLYREQPLNSVLTSKPIHAVFAGRVGRTVVQCWDTEIGCAQPVSWLYLILANRVKYPTGSLDFHNWESCRTMPLVGGFSRGAPCPPISVIVRRDYHVRGYMSDQAGNRARFACVRGEWSDHYTGPTPPPVFRCAALARGSGWRSGGCTNVRGRQRSKSWPERRAHNAKFAPKVGETRPRCGAVVDESMQSQRARPASPRFTPPPDVCYMSKYLTVQVTTRGGCADASVVSDPHLFSVDVLSRLTAECAYVKSDERFGREIREKTRLTSDIVRHDSHMRKSGSDPAED